MDLQTIRSDMLKLRGMLKSRDSKYIRNLNRYNNNGNRREDLHSHYIYPQAYVMPAQGTGGTQTVINVIKSVIDTLVSKIAQAKVRPFFNPVNGDWKTRKVCRNAQVFFDSYYEENNIHKEAISALRDACIFDLGVVWCDEVQQVVKRIPPWEYYLDPAEYFHKRITRAMIIQKNYPVAALIPMLSDKYKALLDKNSSIKCEYAVYYDLLSGIRYDFIDTDLMKETKVEYTQINGLYKRPFAEIFYNQPIKSFFAVSLCDELYTLQVQIDELNARIDASTRNGMTNTVYVPRGGEVKASQLDNGAGSVVYYTPGADGGAPVVSTPPAIHQQFVDIAQLMEQKAYNLPGISQLSAQSKKPTGIQSGIALQTLEDVESERHEVILSAFITLNVDIAKMMIDTFEPDSDIMPQQIGRAKVKWKEIKNQRDAYMIQFSAGSSLSKDPAVKLQQINTLIQMGLIDRDSAASLLELPDIEDAFSHSTSSFDYCQKIIERAIEEEIYEFYETVNLAMLRKEIVKTINHLDAVDENLKYIDRLKKLFVKVNDGMKAVAMQTAQDMAPQQMEVPGLTGQNQPPVPQMQGGTPEL